MVALIVGIVFIGLSVFAALPPLAWWDYILTFLKGGAPVLGVFIGLIAIFIGIADIKDRIEAKKEEAEEAKQEETKS
jgi:hypothetical protein